MYEADYEVLQSQVHQFATMSPNLTCIIYYSEFQNFTLSLSIPCTNLASKKRLSELPGGNLRPCSHPRSQSCKYSCAIIA